MQLKPVRGSTRGGKEIWRWPSKDRCFVVYAVIEPTADLTLHFSTSDPAFEGKPIKVKVGSLRREATLGRVSAAEIHAEVVIKRRERPKRLTDISIEIA